MQHTFVNKSFTSFVIVTFFLFRNVKMLVVVDRHSIKWKKTRPLKIYQTYLFSLLISISLYDITLTVTMNSLGPFKIDSYWKEKYLYVPIFDTIFLTRSITKIIFIYKIWSIMNFLGHTKNKPLSFSVSKEDEISFSKLTRYRSNQRNKKGVREKKR